MSSNETLLDAFIECVHVAKIPFEKHGPHEGLG